MGTSDVGHHDVATTLPLRSRQEGGDDAQTMRALREKNRFWNEKPATRFCVYFCVLVISEVLVGITLHWIFHII
ncbi:MAG TPA: hypothetical protein VN043_17670 [Rhodanobacter sp.]|nr:hypothetical protein [Rhodanobacter sp.]